MKEEKNINKQKKKERLRKRSGKVSLLGSSE
jgi:hypothetical protein